MNWRLRLLNGTDRLLSALLAGMLLGSALAFGGAVWWARPALAILAAAWVLALCLRALIDGAWRVLKSPLTGLGALALLLALAQLVPLPGALADRVSPRARAVHATGLLDDLARADDPEVVLPEPSASRSPVSLDRSATLRWLLGAMGCLGLFWGVSHFADRLGRLYLVWGCIVAAFGINTAIVLVQLACGAGGLYGHIHPGRGPVWAPTTLDLIESPTAVVLRPLPEGVGRSAVGSHPAWAVPKADRPFFVGTMMGGAGAYLALGALGLPLGLAVTLQVLAPRGSREDLATRLRLSGRGSLALLLILTVVAGSVLVGAFAGPLLAIPFGLALAAVGLPSAWPSGLRWSALGLTALALAGLGGGVATGEAGLVDPALRPMAGPDGLAQARAVWVETAKVVRDFPLLGVGLGGFPAIHPYYKALDHAPTTARSSLLQFWAEAGTVGMALLGLAALWALARLPGALRSVGSADRALACGMVGAVLGFGVFSVVHWTVELSAVALAASAVGGTCNRWLAGGTDLFVERG